MVVLRSLNLTYLVIWKVNAGLPFFVVQFIDSEVKNLSEMRHQACRVTFEHSV